MVFYLISHNKFGTRLYLEIALYYLEVIVKSCCFRLTNFPWGNIPLEQFLVTLICHYSPLACVNLGSSEF